MRGDVRKVHQLKAQPAGSLTQPGGILLRTEIIINGIGKGVLNSDAIMASIVCKVSSIESFTGVMIWIRFIPL